MTLTAKRVRPFAVGINSESEKAGSCSDAATGSGRVQPDCVLASRESANLELDPAVQLPGRLTGTAHGGLCFTVAHDGHLTHRDTQVV
jgi:hypothetical protein